MAIEYTSSSDFATLASQLQQSPEDPYLKQKVVKYFPYMQQLAKTNPLALYHLAHVYHEKSDQYKNMVLKAAELGCTNAMLAACKFLVESQKPEHQQTAKFYLAQIESSQDSFIIEHSKQLLAVHPHLAPATPTYQEMIVNAGTGSYGFFAKADKKALDTVPEQQNSYQPGA